MGRRPRAPAAGPLVAGAGGVPDPGGAGVEFGLGDRATTSAQRGGGPAIGPAGANEKIVPCSRGRRLVRCGPISQLPFRNEATPLLFTRARPRHGFPGVCARRRTRRQPERAVERAGVRQPRGDLDGVHEAREGRRPDRADLHRCAGLAHGGLRVHRDGPAQLPRPRGRSESPGPRSRGRVPRPVHRSGRRDPAPRLRLGDHRVRLQREHEHDDVRHRLRDAGAVLRPALPAVAVPRDPPDALLAARQRPHRLAVGSAGLRPEHDPAVQRRLARRDPAVRGAPLHGLVADQRQRGLPQRGRRGRADRGRLGRPQGGRPADRRHDASRPQAHGAGPAVAHDHRARQPHGDGRLDQRPHPRLRQLHPQPRAAVRPGAQPGAQALRRVLQRGVELLLPAVRLALPEDPRGGRDQPDLPGVRRRRRRGAQLLDGDPVRQAHRRDRADLPAGGRGHDRQRPPPGDAVLLRRTGQLDGRAVRCRQVHGRVHRRLLRAARRLHPRDLADGLLRRGQVQQPPRRRERRGDPRRLRGRAHPRPPALRRARRSVRARLHGVRGYLRAHDRLQRREPQHHQPHPRRADRADGQPHPALDRRRVLPQQRRPIHVLRDQPVLRSLGVLGLHRHHHRAQPRLQVRRPARHHQRQPDRARPDRRNV